MDFLLHRCSGNTYCHYTRRFQRACFSFLAYHKLLPASLEKQFALAHVPKRLNGNFPTKTLAGCLNQRHSLLGIRTVSSSQWMCTLAQPLAGTSKTFEMPECVKSKLNVIRSDMSASLAERIDSEISSDLIEMSQYYFKQCGKLIRPTIALLMAAACNHSHHHCTTDQEIFPGQLKIAAVSEMIHTASLVHDDVIDEANVRRTSSSVNARWGNKKAILVGDFILAKATQMLCSIGNPDVVRMLAQVIEDLVKGELMQLGTRETAEGRFVHYMERIFKKTGTLFAHSCQAVAYLSAICPNDPTRLFTPVDDVTEAAFQYGRHLGMAFQLIDDVLDFVSKQSELGKPVASDLKLGLATAPVLFAARQDSNLEALILRRFSEPGDVQKAWDLVLKSNGLEKTKQLAELHCKQAIAQAQLLPKSEHTAALIKIARMQVSRHH